METRSIPQRNILVIEDERDIAELVALHLRDNDFEVTIARDGYDGMRQACARNWDLIILDLRLPGTDGNKRPQSKASPSSTRG